MGAPTEQIARVASTQLGPEDHGIFTADIRLDFGGSMQGCGGYDLRHGESCFRFINGVLRVCRVQSWEQVKGTTVYALIDENHMVCGLRSLPFGGDQQEFLFRSIYDEASK